MPANAEAPSARTRVKRAPLRGHYDRATADAVIDAGILCHVAYVIDGQPYVTPTCHWRDGDHVYWHGSSASRMLRAQAGGIAVCLTVSHLDGLVMARSGFHHSVNYRSVMILGNAEEVTGDDEIERALKVFMDRIAPGRWQEVRPINPQEMKATKVMRLKIEEFSVKIRTGGPIDDDEDYARPVWAGVVPLTTALGAPVDDPRLIDGIERPSYLAAISIEK